MPEAVIAIAVATGLATGTFRLLIRYGPKRKNATRFDFLPWLLTVVGLSLVAYQVLDIAIDNDDAVMLIERIRPGLAYAKSQQVTSGG